MKPPACLKVSPFAPGHFSIYCLLFLFLLSVPLSATSQISTFYDDFEYSDNTLNSSWQGDLNDFVIVTEAPNNLLRLNGSDTGGINQLSTESNVAFGTWDFFLRLDSFTPSNNNRAYIFLTADQADLNGNVNGYALRTGENGQPKHFRIVRFDNGSETTIVTASSNLEPGDYRVKITRDADGTWSLYTSEGFESIPVIENEQVVDNTHTHSSYFGIKVHYTSTRRDRFYFDEFYIRNFTDPLQVADVRVNNARELDIIFTEHIDESSLNPGQFLLNGLKAPDSALLISRNIVRLTFNTPLQTGVHELSANQVRDDRGQIIKEGNRFEFQITNPFKIEKVLAHSGDALDLFFTQAVNSSSITNTNFTANNFQSPISHSVPNGDNMVRLLFEHPFESGKHQLDIENIISEAGWVLSNNTTTHFSIFDEFTPGDVVINEFMYRPPGEMPTYVEVKSTTEKYLNIKGWHLKDNTVAARLITDQDMPLTPGAFLAVTDDTTRLNTLFDRRDFHEMGPLPSLNRTVDDQVRLFDDKGILVDSLLYSPSDWGGDGVSLERKSSGTPTYLRDNWGESPSDRFGTPGLENLVLPDTDAPAVQLTNADQATKLSILFNKTPDGNSAVETANYSLSPFIEIVSADQKGALIYLNLMSPLQNGREYELRISYIEDIFGNRMDDQLHTLTWHAYQQPQERDVIINEFLYRPVAGGMQRFLEIYNRSDKNFDLNQWQIGRGVGSPSTLRGSPMPDGSTSSIPLSQGQYLVFSADPASLSETDNLMTLSGFPAFSRFGDAVYIRDALGNRIDSLYYSPGWGGNVDGRSLQRIDPDGASNDPFNWSEGTKTSAGTQNINHKSDTTLPKVIFTTLTDDHQILVRLNKFITHNQKTTFHIGANKLSLIHFDPFNANTLLFEYDDELNQSNEVILQANGLQDYSGNINETSSIPVSRLIQRGDLVINEIMYRPRSDRYSDLPDQSDYIELYNRSDHAISLEGFYLHDRPDRNNQISKKEPVNTLAGWIPANQYAVVYADHEPTFENTRISSSFDVPGDERFYRVNKNTFSLSVSGDEVFLANRDGLVIDSVTYQDNWHNSNLIDTRGVSLERISPEG
ncbi:MAG: lamin tail domain-containing protein, partial [Balneolales bacterium]